MNVKVQICITLFSLSPLLVLAILNEFNVIFGVRIKKKPDKIFFTK